MQKILKNSLVSIEEAYKKFPWDDKYAYAMYLAQTYYYVCHSTRLLAFAAARMGVDNEKNHRRFLAHTTEEKGHHLLALNDVKALDFNIATLPELESTQAFYESQYYKIEFQDPLALMGYILVLEGLAVSIGSLVYKKLNELHGEVPNSFFKVHSEEDPGHLKAAFDVVTGLSDVQKKYVEKNILQSTFMLCEILRQIQEKRFEVKKVA